MSQCAEFPNDNPRLHRGVIWVCLDTTGAPSADREAVPVPVLTRVVEPEPIVDVEPAPVEILELVAVVVEEEAVPSDVIAAEIALSLTENRPSGIVAITHVDDDADDDEPIVVEEIEPLGDVETISMAPIAAVEAVAIAEEEPPPPTLLDDPFVQLCCALADVASAASAPEAATAITALLLEGTIDGALSPEVRACLAEGGIADGDRVTEAFAATARAWRAILLGTSDDLSACGAATLDEWAADLVARLLGAPQRAALLKRDLRSRGVAAWGLIAA